MFEDSLVESSGRLAARHPWTTAVSFACQGLALSFLLLLSLLYTETLPTQRWIKVLQAPPPPSEAQTQIAATSTAHNVFSASVLMVPREVPNHVVIIHDQLETEGVAPVVAIGVPGAAPVGMSGRVLDIMKFSVPAPKPTVQKLRVSSGVAEGMLLHQVKPRYPSPARVARVEGRVVLQAIIGKDGGIENLRVISGHPLLAPAALDAVKQWRYQPYFLNGEPVEVETQIVVNFVLAHD